MSAQWGKFCPIKKKIQFVQEKTTPNYCNSFSHVVTLRYNILKNKKNIMRQTNKTFMGSKMIGMGVMAMLLAILPSACCDNDVVSQGGNNSVINAEEFEPAPTEDQVGEKYTGLTAIVGTDLTDLGQAIAKRAVNKTEQVTENVKAVVLTPKTLQNGITTEQAANLIKLYEGGACVILLDPQRTNWERMGAIMEQGEQKLEEEGYCSTRMHSFLQQLEMLRSQNTAADDAQYDNDAVAFRLNSTYIISDLEQQAKLSIENTQVTITDENGNQDVKDVEDMEYEVSDYRYGQSADLLVQWMKNAEEDANQLQQGRAAAVAEMKTRGANGVLEDLLTAQTVIKQKTVGPSRVFGETMPYEFCYYIYALYSFDKKEEYYYIRQHINFHASKLGCTKNELSSWTKSPKGKKIRFDDGRVFSDEYFFGPYMRKSKITTTLENVDSKTVTLVGPKPESSTGSQGYSYGFASGVNFSGNWGANSSGPTGGYTLGASWSWATSENYTAPDLIIRQEYDTHCTTSWLLEGLKPKTIYHFWTSNEHTKVSNFQVSDWSADLTWYYRIENPDKRKVYSLLVTDYTEIAELNYTFYDYELAVHPLQSHTVELTPPNRYSQEWVMSCTNEALLNNVKEQLKNSWDNNPTTYALTEELLEVDMKKRFGDIKKKVQGIASILKSQGYTDRYVFCVRKQGIDENFMAFTLDNGVVTDGGE